MGFLMKKTGIALLSAAVLAITSAASASSGLFGTAEAADTTNSTYNYGEALQKSMFFYEVQQCGELPDWNEVSWRDDCMVNDYIPGGWFDAGDHLKFTLTNAYAATMLGWGLLEYQDGVKEIGELTEYKNNLAWALDYVASCDLGDEIVYMIGDGAFDHVWWGSAEVYMRKFKLMKGEDARPYYTCNDSCIEGQMAAALAVQTTIWHTQRLALNGLTKIAPSAMILKNIIIISQAHSMTTCSLLQTGSIGQPVNNPIWICARPITSRIWARKNSPLK